ncbi:MAG TPA: hypothetical protein VGB47_09325, partial [Thermoanaerobaculia bacterium]
WKLFHEGDEAFRHFPVNSGELKIHGYGDSTAAPILQTAPSGWRLSGESAATPYRAAADRRPSLFSF